MPKGRKNISLKPQTFRRLNDLIPKTRKKQRGKYDRFINELLDIYTANPKKGSQLPVDTKISNTSNPFEAPECYYRAIDVETGKWYCDLKEVPRVACIQRQSRFISQGKRCYPKGMKFRRSTRKRQENSSEKPFTNRGAVFKGHEADGRW